MYRETYLTPWPTAEELDDVEPCYQRKGFPGCVGAIEFSKLFWNSCRSQDKGQYLSKKDLKLASIQCEAWYDPEDKDKRRCELNGR